MWLTRTREKLGHTELTSKTGGPFADVIKELTLRNTSVCSATQRTFTAGPRVAGAGGRGNMR